MLPPISGPELVTVVEFAECLRNSIWCKVCETLTAGEHERADRSAFGSSCFDAQGPIISGWRQTPAGPGAFAWNVCPSSGKAGASAVIRPCTILWWLSRIGDRHRWWCFRSSNFLFAIRNTSNKERGNEEPRGGSSAKLVVQLGVFRRSDSPCNGSLLTNQKPWWSQAGQTNSFQLLVCLDIKRMADPEANGPGRTRARGPTFSQCHKRLTATKQSAARPPLSASGSITREFGHLPTWRLPVTKRYTRDAFEGNNGRRKLTCRRPCVLYYGFVSLEMM